MRKATFLLIFFTLGTVMVAALITAGMLTGRLWVYILALWFSVLLMIIFLSFYVRTYRRVMTRLGITNERLAEIKLLQERRYERLAQRLDALSQGTSGAQRSTPTPSDVEQVITRFERSERRILGRLEGILLDNDRHFRTVQKLASDCSDHTEND